MVGVSTPNEPDRLDGVDPTDQRTIIPPPAEDDPDGVIAADLAEQQRRADAYIGTNDQCPLCGAVLSESPHVRDQLVLHDETDGSVGHVARRLCAACWQFLYAVVTGPPPTTESGHEQTELPGGDEA